MGMFDTFTFGNGLMNALVKHLGPQRDDEEDFQTKWFGCHLDTYHVDDDGRITATAFRGEYDYGDPNDLKFTDGHFNFYFLNNRDLLGYIVDNKLKYVTTWMPSEDRPIIEIGCADYIVIPPDSSEFDRLRDFLMKTECSLILLEEESRLYSMRCNQPKLVDGVQGDVPNIVLELPLNNGESDVT